MHRAYSAVRMTRGTLLGSRIYGQSPKISSSPSRRPCHLHKVSLDIFARGGSHRATANWSGASDIYRSFNFGLALAFWRGPLRCEEFISDLDIRSWPLDPRGSQHFVEVGPIVLWKYIFMIHHEHACHVVARALRDHHPYVLLCRSFILKFFLPIFMVFIFNLFLTIFVFVKLQSWIGVGFSSFT